jgi:hypothetical protein
VDFLDFNGYDEFSRFSDYGWRFLIASSLLVVVGLYPIKITETPALKKRKEEEVKIPFYLTEIL